MVRHMVLILAAAAGAAAQDCIVAFSLTAAGNSAQLDNRDRGCTSFGVAYTATGFSALTLAFQSAPDNSGSPGAWVTYAGTVVTGSNPSTATTQASGAFSGYFPWLRVNLSGLTGSGQVIGVFYGWRTPAVAVSGGGGTSNVNLAQVGGVAIALGQAAMAASLPVAIASNQSPVNMQPGCDQSAVIDVSSSGDTQIIAASGSASIRICHFSISAASAVNVKLTRGAGANCDTGPADITGTYQAVTSMALDPFGALRTASSNAVCLNLGAAVTVGGLVTYGYFQ